MNPKSLLLLLTLFAAPALADVSQEPGTGQQNRMRDGAINFPPDNPKGASIAIGQFAMNKPAVGGPNTQANIAIGYLAMGGVMTSTAVNNIAIGYNASNLTSGANNTIIGVTAKGAASGSRNIIMGVSSASSVNATTDYVHIDPEGSTSISAGINNVTIGTHIGYSQNGGTVVGADAMYSDINVGNGFNTVFGANVGRTNIGVGGTVPTQVLMIGGNFNTPQTIILDGASSASTNFIDIGLGHAGTNDTVIGYGALISNTGNASKNTVIGRNAMTALTTGTNSIALGYSAGSTITTGSNNTVLGYSVGSSTLTTGGGNILIGTSSGVTTPGAATASMLNIGGVVYGHLAGTAVPVLSSCGTSPSVDARANNASGTVTTGSGILTSCTVTFSSAYTSWNHCQVTSQAGKIAGLAYTYTTSAITITGTSITSDVFDYKCDGF